MKALFQRQFVILAVSLCVLPVLLSASDRTVLVADESSSLTQNSRADDENLSRMADLAMVRRFARNGYLVAVPENTSTFYLKSIPDSYQYCRPWTKLFLTRLATQYHAKFGDRLRVTSLVRTERRQRYLTRVNGNAADASGPSRSSHLTGATIDISKRFMSNAEIDWMRDVLYSLREAGYVYAIEEFYQPTFHVMVYRSYPQYVHRLSRRPAVKRASRETPHTETADAKPEDSDVAER